MCGDYNSVIGMNKDNSLKRFFKKKDATNHFPSEGEGTLSGIVVEADEKTGLAKKVLRIIIQSSVLKLFSFRMLIILFLFFAKQLSISSENSKFSLKLINFNISLDDNFFSLLRNF